MRMHFLSGLPRAGTTLLASILCQNPKFHASIMTPVGRIVTQALQSMGPENEASSFLMDEQKACMLRGIFDGYYHKWRGGEPVVFDNNRRWTANMGLLHTLYPSSRVICCLRDPRAIVDSFERLFQRNPLTLSVIFNGKSNLTVYERVNEIMAPGNAIGFPLAAFATAFYGPYRDRLYLVEYDDLCRFPQNVLNGIHAALGLSSFRYDFKNIKPIHGAKQFDADVSTPGLHDLKPAVVYEPRSTILPPEIIHQLPNPFWRSKEAVTPAQ